MRAVSCKQVRQGFSHSSAVLGENDLLLPPEVVGEVTDVVVTCQHVLMIYC